MKSFVITLLALFFASFAISQKGVVNNGVKMTISNGAVLKITGDDANYTNEDNGEIDLDGIIVIEGDWTNNAASGNVLVNTDTDGEVIFTGTALQTISGTTPDILNFEKVTIDNAAIVAIEAGDSVTLFGDFTNNGTFTIKSVDTISYASFIDNGTISGSGTNNVERFMSGHVNGTVPDGRWWYISPPVAGATSAVIDDICTYHRLYWYNETNTGTHGWNQIMGDATGLNVMQGYATRLDADNTATFTGGALNTGVKNIAITYTTGVDKAGFNLIGNPYPSAVDWEIGAGWTKNMIVSDSYWFRSYGTFPTYNGNSDVGTMGATPVIPPVQAFWVQTLTGGTFEVNNNARVHGTMPFYKEDENILRFAISSETFMDEIVVGFRDEANMAYDKYDTEKLMTNGVLFPQVYSLIGELEMAINSFRKTEETQSVPLGFIIDHESEYIFSAYAFETLKDVSDDVWLEDKQEGTIQNLAIYPEYIFNSSPGQFDSRFVLHFGPQPTGIIEDLETIYNIYSYGNSIFVNAINGEGTGKVIITNMIGQTIYVRNIHSTVNKFEMDVDAGYYIVRLQTNEQVYTKKVFIN